MTLQILSVNVGGTAQIELHGRLSALEVTEFRSVCAAQPAPVTIDLTNLSGASAEGILALRAERARGARLTGASPYIELLLEDSSVQHPKQSKR